jgi:hypothetical protein
MSKKIYKAIFIAVACLCLLMICLIPGVPGAAAGSDILFGDVNGDDQINVADAITLLRHIVGLNDLEPDEIGRANVSASYDAAGNPTLDVSDAILVLRQIVGLTSEFPAQSAAFFTCFSLDLPEEAVQIDLTAQTVTLMVPYCAGSLEGKTALFGLPYGASVMVEDVLQTSGATHPDFRDPVPYKIIAPDGSTAAWTVSVRRYGEASGCWSREGIPPMYFTSKFRVSVLDLECATHYEVYAEDNGGEMVLLSGPDEEGDDGEDDDEDGDDKNDRFAIEEPLIYATIILGCPAKLEVRFYDGADSATPVAVARCSGTKNATAGDLIF